MSMLEIISPFIEEFCANILKHGRVPRHVAFVADGARRFGKKHRIPVCENHEIGLEKCMMDVIDWCLLLGIREYSILMFSFGNYYRPPDETQHWIDVLKFWLFKCIRNWRVLKSKGIRFNFYGKYEWIPTEINALMGILILLTKDNDKVTVNMAMGYTSKHEMSAVAFKLYSGFCEGKIQSNYVSAEVFNECLFAIENHDVDLFIRTSGYKRISNIFCWQSSNGVIYYCDCLWPEFSKINFLKAIFYYQSSVILKKCEPSPKFDDVQLLYLQELKRSGRHSLMKYCLEMNYISHDDIELLYSTDYESIYRQFELACSTVFWYE